MRRYGMDGLMRETAPWALAVLLLALGVTAHTPPLRKSTLELMVPPEFVQGFPMLVTVRVVNLDFDYPAMNGTLSFPWKLWSLGSRHIGGREIQVIAESDSSKAFTLGGAGAFQYDGTCGPDRTRPPTTGDGTIGPGDLAVMAPGESYSTTFDLCQLTATGSKTARTRWSQLPGPGEWELRPRFFLLDGAQQKTSRVQVREPNTAEREVANQLGHGVENRSWFPDVVLADKAVPAVDGLPMETRVVVELIAVLRAAVQSPQAGLEAIDTREEISWGHLDHLISTVEYECALAMKDKGRAQALRERVVGEASDALELRLVDEGKGLLAQLKEARSPAQ